MIIIYKIIGPISQIKEPVWERPKPFHYLNDKYVVCNSALFSCQPSVFKIIDYENDENFIAYMYDTKPDIGGYSFLEEYHTFKSLKDEYMTAIESIEVLSEVSRARFTKTTKPNKLTGYLFKYLLALKIDTETDPEKRTILLKAFNRQSKLYNITPEEFVQLTKKKGSMYIEAIDIIEYFEKSIIRNIKHLYKKPISLVPKIKEIRNEVKRATADITKELKPLLFKLND